MALGRMGLCWIGIIAMCGAARGEIIEVNYRAQMTEAYAPLPLVTYIDFTARYDTENLIENPTGDFLPAIEHELLLNDVPASIELVRLILLPGGTFSLVSAKLTHPLQARMVLQFATPQPDPFALGSLGAGDMDGFMLAGQDEIDLNVSFTSFTAIGTAQALPAPGPALVFLAAGLCVKRRRNG